MYFWKIDNLKNDLKNGPLTENESFKYLLATVIIYNLGMLNFGENNQWNLYFNATTGLISILGTVYIYICNGGKNGQNFIQRYLSLAFVLSIRWLAIVLIPISISYFIILEIFFYLPDTTTPSDIVFFSFIYLSYFYLFRIHIKDLLK